MVFQADAFGLKCRAMGSNVAWLAGLFVAVGFTYLFATQQAYQGGLEDGLEAERMARTRAAALDLPRVTGLEGRITEILLIPDPILRMEKLAGALGALDGSALEPVRDAYKGVLIEIGDPEIVLFVEWWARFDPEGAFQWTRTNWEANIPSVAASVARAWARIDPMAAYAVVGPLDDQDRPLAPYVVAVVQGWAESGKPGLDEFIAQLPPGHRSRATTVTVRRKIRRDGPVPTIAWAEAAPLEQKLRIYQRLASGLAEVDPEAARAFAEKHVSGPYGKRLPRRVATRWIRSDPEAAMNWLETLEPGFSRDDAVTEAYRRWLGRDPGRARAWMEENASEVDQRWLEPAKSLHAHDISYDAPEEAANWAKRMVQDPELRLAALANPVRSWVLQDEAAARDWVVRESGLSEEFQERVLIVPNTFRFNYELYMAEKAKREAQAD